MSAQAADNKCCHISCGFAIQILTVQQLTRWHTNFHPCKFPAQILSVYLDNKNYPLSNHCFDLLGQQSCSDYLPHISLRFPDVSATVNFSMMQPGGLNHIASIISLKLCSPLEVGNLMFDNKPYQVSDLFMVNSAKSANLV